MLNVLYQFFLSVVTHDSWYLMIVGRLRARLCGFLIGCNYVFGGFYMCLMVSNGFNLCFFFPCWQFEQETSDWDSGSRCFYVVPNQRYCTRQYGGVCTPSGGLICSFRHRDICKISDPLSVKYQLVILHRSNQSMFRSIFAMHFLIFLCI